MASLMSPKRKRKGSLAIIIIIISLSLCLTQREIQTEIFINIWDIVSSIFGSKLSVKAYISWLLCVCVAMHEYPFMPTEYPFMPTLMCVQEWKCVCISKFTTGYTKVPACLLLASSGTGIYLSIVLDPHSGRHFLSSVLHKCKSLRRLASALIYLSCTWTY